MVRGEDWTNLPAARPTRCPATDPVIRGAAPWQPAGEGIEVGTEGCNDVSITQPLQQDLAEGDLIRLTASLLRLGSR